MKLRLSVLFYSLIFSCLSTASETFQPSEIFQLESVLGCLVEPSRKIAVSSPIPGVLEQMRARRGETVKKGELLFQLRAGVQAATVELAKAKAEFARRNLKRNTNLYTEEMLSEHERDEIETESLIAQKELQVAREELALRRVKSPAAAIVVDRHNEAGEFISNEPVLNLAVLNPLNVELLISSEKFGQFEAGDTLSLLVPYAPDGEYKAKITIVDPIIDPSSATFRVRASLENPDLSIPSGVSCTLAMLPAGNK